jgi:hypothetical protein
MGKIKYLTVFAGWLVLFLGSTTQDIQHQAVAINIEVPVRVFKGNEFIAHLTMEDFEIFEDGAPQEIDAVYLITKTEVQRQEKSEEIEKIPAPKVSRCFVLIFEVINWLPRINDLIDYFFNMVYQPGDQLLIATPVKSYELSEKALNEMPKNQIGIQLKNLLREDILQGNREYQSLLRDIISFNNIQSFDNRLLMEDLYRRLRDYKYFDEEKLQSFSNAIKQKEGQKHIFLFYQKEKIPVPEGLDELKKMKSFSFDTKKIKQIFADSEITTHFLFLNKDVVENLGVEWMRGIQSPMSDVSMEVFSAFHEIAKTTGGETYVSSNAALAFKQASAASENYYLLYYTPKNYKADNQFHKIEVKVKGGGFRITHRAGYIAD